MFADADLDLKKIAKNDTVLANLTTLSDSSFFEENFEILAAVFHEKGMIKGDHLEISKIDFINVLKDAGILIIQKVEKVEEGKKDSKKPADGKFIPNP